MPPKLFLVRFIFLLSFFFSLSIFKACAKWLSLSCAQSGLLDTVLHCLEFTVYMNSLAKKAKPQNKGGNEEVLYHKESLSGLSGLASQLPPSYAHNRASVLGQTLA